MDSYDKVTDKRVREISNVDLTSIFKCAFISKPQNSTLGNCATNGVDVHLFEVMDEGRYTYCGRIELVGNPYTETQLGEDGAPRLVWMFPIRPVPENDVKKPGMFVFKDMEDYRKNGKNVDARYNAKHGVKAGKATKVERIASIEEAKQSGKQDAPKKGSAPQKKHSSPNQTNTIKWDPGKRRTYYVFQGGSFDDEYTGGYIWAPYESKSGRPFHYWERLKDLQAGDMIFHAAHGKIKAISFVREPYSIVPRLERTAGLPNEEEPGYLVRCDYTYINDPISAWDYTEVIKQYSHVKYSPFNSNGTGNLGYLYELDQRLAAFFLEESIKKNPSLGEIDFVREFMA